MEYKFDKSTVLYKGVRENGLASKLSEPCWFATDCNVAKMYAITYLSNVQNSETYSFSLKRDLKLINLLSISFRMDFWDKCNTQMEPEDPERIHCLVAIGICSLEDQQVVSKRVDDCDPMTRLKGNLIGGHRCSSPESDIIFVKTLKKFYESDGWDGYIIPSNIPSCFHGTFHKELCLFDALKCIDESGIKGLERFTQTGGGNTVKSPTKLSKINFPDKYLIAREHLTPEDWAKIPPPKLINHAEEQKKMQRASKRIEREAKARGTLTTVKIEPLCKKD